MCVCVCVCVCVLFDVCVCVCVVCVCVGGRVGERMQVLSFEICGTAVYISPVFWADSYFYSIEYGRVQDKLAAHDDAGNMRTPSFTSHSLQSNTH